MLQNSIKFVIYGITTFWIHKSLVAIHIGGREVFYYLICKYLFTEENSKPSIEMYDVIIIYIYIYMYMKNIH